MAEMKANAAGRSVRIRHRGRGSQVWIYLGKLLRMFVYQNDWKVLPMSALVAGLVGLVVRRRFFINMEGTLMGAFALTCVAIWNGCFNSIQVICRERGIIKREHRSGMHISSYVFAHMAYQALLCLMQTGVTMYVTRLTGVQYPAEGLFTSWLIVDIGISVFLISFAADMLSLLVSALARTTTTAMTIMPFVLIFQLVFSGGMLTLPAWSEIFSHFTISNYGLKVICSQADYNNRPLVTAWNTLERMRDQEVGGSFTLGQVLDLLQQTDNPAVAEIRAKQLGRVFTLGEVKEKLDGSESYARLKQKKVARRLTLGDLSRLFLNAEGTKQLRSIKVGDFSLEDLVRTLVRLPGMQKVLEIGVTPEMTVGEVLDKLQVEQLLANYSHVELGGVTTVGEAADAVAANPDTERYRDRSITVKTTVGKLLDLAGEDRVKELIQRKAAEASFNPDYENSADNIIANWICLIGFALLYVFLATVILEFIDRDKR